MIEQKVEDVLRASFEDWISFLKETLELSMSYLAPHNDTLIECCQRRNLLVHNNGVVNNIYIARVAANVRKGLKVGDKIPVTKEYVDKAIRSFEVAFLLIAAELWKKLEANDPQRGDTLIELGFKQLKREHWDTAEGVYMFLVLDKGQSELSWLIAQVNHWQCLKWQGRLDECRKDIEGSDLSAKDERFALARFALLDNTEEFFKLAPKLIRSKKLTLDNLFDWPLFKEMRKTKQFTKTYGKRYEVFTSKSSKHD